MALQLDHLDDRTRQFMLQEVNSDIDNGVLYISGRLSSVGHVNYPGLLKEAVSSKNDDWLASKLQENGYMNMQEVSHRNGKPFTKKVPVGANITLSEGEFNRFYIRGLCLRAIEDGTDSLVICRVKQVTSPRPGSELKIGQKIKPDVLLNDLRTSVGVDTALGLPAGPNSGLSVMLG